tara:strand:- start:368 stop:748 length:381 start_codon:yes stop_codon:yes gene_type:complete
MTKDKEITMFNFQVEKIEDIKKFVEYRNKNRSEDEEGFKDFKIETIKGTLDDRFLDLNDGETFFEIKCRKTTKGEEGETKFKTETQKEETYLVTSFLDISVRSFGLGVKLISVIERTTKTFLQEEE